MKKNQIKFKLRYDNKTYKSIASFLIIKIAEQETTQSLAIYKYEKLLKILVTKGLMYKSGFQEEIRRENTIPWIVTNKLWKSVNQ